MVARRALALPWVVAALAAAASGAAQEPRVAAGAGAAVALPAGSLRHYLGTGDGLAGLVRFGPDGRHVRLLVAAELLNFAPTTRSRPFEVGQVRITTSSRMFVVIAGPEAEAGAGRVRATVAAGAGLASAQATGTVAGLDVVQPLSGVTTFGDLTWALSAGAGLRLRLGGGATPLWLEGGVRRIALGPTRWVREQGIPVRDLSYDFLAPTWSASGLTVFVLVLSVGLRH